METILELTIGYPDDIPQTLFNYFLLYFMLKFLVFPMNDRIINNNKARKAKKDAKVKQNPSDDPRDIP